MTLGWGLNVHSTASCDVVYSHSVGPIDMNE